MNTRCDFYQSRAPVRARECARYYHVLLQKYFAFLVPPDVRVLELGCGLGDLLAAVKPAHGVGVDFSPTRLVSVTRVFNFTAATQATGNPSSRSITS